MLTVGIFQCLNVEKLTASFFLQDKAGEITEVHVTCEDSTTCAKPKAFVHWVSKPLSCEVRLYERL